MKRFLIYTVLLFVAIVARGAEPTSLEHWEAGNSAYSAKEYGKAIVEYKAIVDGGEYSLELYYNLANAYFKADSLGKAILYYNKALRIDPSQEDFIHNLAFAEVRTKDKVAQEPEFFLSSWARALRNSLSCTAWSVMSLVALGLFLAFVLLFLLASDIKVRKAGFIGALCALVLGVAVTAFAISSRNNMLHHDEAIVMASAISIKSSPDRSATDIFVLHEGTMVRILSEVDEWREITIADGKKGWVEAKNIEQI
jgi:tetratricopeptide (TPR) repeat protein